MKGQTPRASTARDLQAIMSSLEEFVNARVRALATDLAVDVSHATPIATTHAASNWIWRSEPSTSPAGSRANVTWAPYASGIAGLGAWTIRQGALYMSNMVKYIGRLDQGWSRQAPPGYVGDTIRAVLDRHGGRQ